MTRQEALLLLLEPPDIRPGMRIEGARLIVLRARERVRTAYPFLTDDEKREADEWLKRNEHEHLWDDTPSPLEPS